MKDESPNSDVTQNSQTKILHLLLDKDRRFPLFENLVVGLNKQIFSQVICYLRGSDNKHNPLQQSGYEVVGLGIPKQKLKRFSPSVVFQLSRIIREKHIDIVHCQRHKSTVYGTLSAWIVGKHVKVVATVHGRGRTRNLGRKLLNRALFKRISRIISVSKAVRDDILKTNRFSSPDKVVTVYNGIDAERFSKPRLTQHEARTRLGLADKETFVFGTVGRATKVKGQSVLLKAFARVCQKYPDSFIPFGSHGVWYPRNCIKGWGYPGDSK